MSADYINWEEAVMWLRLQPGQEELVSHCYYDDPIETAAERYCQSEEWHAVLGLFEGTLPLRVLDVGAGRGISSYAFVKAGCETVALEPDSSVLVGAGAIRELSDRTKMPIAIIEEKGEELPFSDASFDVVFGRAVFHHAGDLNKFCAEARRVLRPGGTFLMTREHVISRKEDLAAFLDAHPLHWLYGGEKAYLIEEYVEAMSSAGLRYVKMIGPYESVINYAPMTRKEFRSMVAGTSARFLGRRLGAWLAEMRFVREWCGRRLSRKCDTPGRLYTFRATK